MDPGIQAGSIPGHILTALQIAYVHDDLVKGGSIIVKWDQIVAKVPMGHDNVRVRASGVGRRGWNVVWVGVCCGLLWSISYFPLFPSCTQIWCWVNNGFHHHGMPWTCPVVSVPTWINLELQSSWKCPWSNSDLSWKVINPFVSCCGGGWCWGCVVSMVLCLHVLCGPLWVCSYDRQKWVGGLVICKMDLVH